MVGDPHSGRRTGPRLRMRRPGLSVADRDYGRPVLLAGLPRTRGVHPAAHDPVRRLRDLRNPVRCAPNDCPLLRRHLPEPSPQDEKGNNAMTDNFDDDDAVWMDDDGSWHTTPPMSDDDIRAMVAADPNLHLTSDGGVIRWPSDDEDTLGAVGIVTVNGKPLRLAEHDPE
jgi:hypothetical protein